MYFGTENLFRVEPWRIVEDEFIPAKNLITESVFSVANEYMGLRGCFDEPFGGETLAGTYINGIYAKQRIDYAWQRIGFPSYDNLIINTTNWLRLDVEVGGETFDMATAGIGDYERALDMKQGILTRKLVWTAADGAETELRWERFVSHDDRHCGAVRFSLKALNHSKPVKLRFALDATKENTHFGTGRRHSVTLDAKADRELMLLRKIATTGQYYIHRVALDMPAGVEQKPFTQTYVAGLEVTFSPETGVEYHFDRLVSVWTSRDAGHPFGIIAKDCDSSDVDAELESGICRTIETQSREHLTRLLESDYDVLRERHVAAVSTIWDRLDMEIDGDDASQQGIRYCMFQLFNTYRGKDPNLNIGAKGLTGEHYENHYFWDSEAYCIQHYLLTSPEAALNLLECRYNTLDKARERARLFGLEGACYPLQTIDGSEDCGVWEYSLGEIHINAIMSYAIYLYTRTTGDRSYLYERGVEVVIEIARYWATRTSYIPYRKGYGVLKCMGPDEYQQVVDNNYYTNYMAKWALEYADEVLDDMAREAPERLADIVWKLKLRDDERPNWREIAGRMLLPEHDELGILLQDDSILSLDPITREELTRDDIPFNDKWTVQRMQRAELLKQPDVLMLPYLFPERFSRDEVHSNYRYYEQRTVHGSSLSPSIHSILATQIGRRQQAYEYYLYASRLDLDDFNNNTWQGLHISSMAGTWSNVVFGFGGVVIGEDELQIAPTLPQGWNLLRFRLTYRGNLLQVTADKQSVSCEVLQGAGDVSVLIYGEKKLQAPVPDGHYEHPQMKRIIIDLDLSGCLIESEGSSPNPAETVFVSASLDRIAAAAAKGMKTMGIGRKIDFPTADYVLKHQKYVTRERLNMLF